MQEETVYHYLVYNRVSFYAVGLYLVVVEYAGAAPLG
jgi:hypothetical protein